MRAVDYLLRIFKSATSSETTAETTRDAGLSFDGLNPLLAKQLSELESQIGQLAQVQFELSQERRRMREEMDALRKALTQADPNADFAETDSKNETNQ